jgi:hypothetical protein
MRKLNASIIVFTGLLLTIPVTLSARGLYPQPLTPHFEEGDNELTCDELNLEIARLYPQSYSDKPGFYDDPLHGAAIWGGAIWAPGLWSYLPYSGVADYAEHSRQRDSMSRIEALRYLKARRRCHE